MKRLYILRHAQALNTQIGGSDFDRTLSPQGLQDAQALGKLMHDKEYTPTYSLYSAAKRTNETFKALDLDTISKANDELYEAGAGAVMDIIHDFDDKYDSALLVGHNPTVQELAMRLASEESPFSHLQRLMQGYKPGTLCVFDCPCMYWNDLQLAENILTDLLDPMDYNAPSRPTRWM